MSWYLRKEWIDQDDGIEGVVIHYTSSPRGRGVDFGHFHDSRPLQQAGGGRRMKVLAMPRQVWTDGAGWCDEYTFHYRFEVFAAGAKLDHRALQRRHREPRARIRDQDGAITNICIHWAVGDWMAPVYSPMEDPRFPADSEFASIRYYGYWDKPRYHQAKAAMMAQIPLPHLWRSRIWGPRGSTVVQQYHIGHMYPENEQAETFLGPDGRTTEFASSWTHQM